jgi:iron complex transport system ATP-binding protein
VVPQDFSVQFAYTVRQLVELGRMPHTGSWGILRATDREAVEEALRATALAGLADRVFNELSGGERQRVLVAMALAQESDIVLLDEPTAHLDIRHQVDVLNLMRTLNRERGITVIAALHDLNLAARFFPRLVLFQHGVVADGPPTTVLDSKLLGAVYEIPVRVGILRGEEFLSVLPPGGADQPEPAGSEGKPGAAVHVVAGGGAGELAMRALAEAEVAFTAGALNAGDSDHALAARLAARVVSELPYAPISAAGVAETRECMLAARAVLICPAPFGPGNVALLEAAVEAARAGRRVVLLERSPDGAPALDREGLLARASERDFAGGRAVEAYASLLASGAEIAEGPAAAAQLVGGDDGRARIARPPA